MKLQSLYLLSIFLGFISCIDDVDFNQVDDISIQTKHKTSLIYFKLGQNDFLTNLNTEITTKIDTTRTPIFIGPYTQNYLTKAEFHFEIENTFDRNFIIQYIFLDSIRNQTRVFMPMNVPANTSNYTYTEVIEEPEIATILPSDITVVSINLQNGPFLNSTQVDSLKLKSSVTFTYNIAP